MYSYKTLVKSVQLGKNFDILILWKVGDVFLEGEVGQTKPSFVI